MAMELLGKGKRVRIYVNEDDRIGHRPAAQAILEFLRRENAQGASLIRAASGFGATGRIHTATLVDVVQRLPVIVEWIDRGEVVARLLPQIRTMVAHGLITVDETEIVLYEPHPVRMLGPGMTAADVMSRDVATVEPTAPLRDVVVAMLGRPYGAIPVVDRGRVVGIITGNDLVDRGGLAIRPALLERLDAAEREAYLDALGGRAATAGAVMTRRPVCVAASTPLPDVALLMARRRLKRLPVIDGDGVLVGIVSRYDLLRSAAGGFSTQEAPPGFSGLAVDAPVASVMRRDAPTVHPDTPLSETLQAVVSTRLNLAVVVDDARRVVGLVSDGALLERITPALRPGVLRSLMLRLPFTHPRPGEREAVSHARAQVAGDLMSRSIPTAPLDLKLSEAIALMLRERHKVLAVVGPDGALAGVVDRADLLRGLAVEGE